MSLLPLCQVACRFVVGIIVLIQYITLKSKAQSEFALAGFESLTLAMLSVDLVLDLNLGASYCGWSVDTRLAASAT